MPYDDSRVQKEEENHLFFLWKKTTKRQPPNVLFFFIKAFIFPCHVETCMRHVMIVDLKLQLSADPD